MELAALVAPPTGVRQGAARHEALESGEVTTSSDGGAQSQEEVFFSRGGAQQRPACFDLRHRSLSVIALVVAAALGLVGALEAMRYSRTDKVNTLPEGSGSSFIEEQEAAVATAGAASSSVASTPVAAAATQAVASEPFDCSAGFNNMEAGWSVAKKDWCCTNKAIGCQAGAQEAAGGSADDGACPVCAPQASVSPDLVIPFFERDLCKLKTTAKSLSVNDPNGMFGDVYLMWVSTKHSSEFMEELTEAATAISATHSVQLIEFTDLMEFTDSLSGWHAQQIIKLKAASVVKAPYYVVLDSKNTLIRPLSSDDIFTKCNTAKIQAEFPAAKIPVPHINWYKASAAALEMDPPSSGYWPASITPVVFHTQTV
ncbi:unnamed protein product, partial [Prorocentrum cordatum]